MKVAEVVAISAAFIFVAADGHSTTYTMTLVAATSSPAPAGELAPYDTSSGTVGVVGSDAIHNDEVLMAAIEYANSTYLTGPEGPVSNSVTIKIPEGAYAFAPFADSPTGTLEFIGQGAGTTLTTLTLEPLPVADGATLPSGVIDVSSYEQPSGGGNIAPLQDLTVSSGGHLTISGAGDCVDLSSGTPLLEPVGCSGGTVIYTPDDVPALYGDHTNHVTFTNLGFDRASQYSSQGTVMGATHAVIDAHDNTYTPARSRSP